MKALISMSLLVLMHAAAQEWTNAWNTREVAEALFPLDGKFQSGASWTITVRRLGDAPDLWLRLTKWPDGAHEMELRRLTVGSKLPELIKRYEQLAEKRGEEPDLQSFVKQAPLETTRLTAKSCPELRIFGRRLEAISLKVVNPEAVMFLHGVHYDLEAIGPQGLRLRLTADGPGPGSNDHPHPISRWFEDLIRKAEEKCL